MGNWFTKAKPTTNAKSVGEVTTGGNHFEVIHLPSAGGALGFVLVVLLLVAAGWLMVRRCRNKDKALALEHLKHRAKGGRVEEGFPMVPMGHSPYQPPIVISAPPMSPPMSPLGCPPWGAQPMLGFQPRPALPRRYDEMRIEEIDEPLAKSTPNRSRAASPAPEGEPRHAATGPDGRRVYAAPGSHEER